MSQIIHVQGIVLRTTNYSESSIICDIYTDQLGTKGYIVSGVRGGKSTNSKGVFFQPAALLNLVVYNNEFKNLNRMKEYSWGYIYNQIFFNVFRNAAAIFMVELLSRTLRQPDHHPLLFQFARQTLIDTDTVDKKRFANIPIYFMVHLLKHLGFGVSLKEIAEHPVYQAHFREYMIPIIQDFANATQVDDLQHIQINKEIRHQLFEFLHIYYRTHIVDFGNMKSYSIIKDLFNDH